MKSKNLYIMVSLLVVALLSGSFIKQESTEEAKKNKELIKFSHQFHINEAEVDCASCHTSAAESRMLKDKLLPTKEDCASCHDVDDEENCNLCHYEDVYEPLVQPAFKIIFDHKFHLSEQKVECETCHAGLNEVDYGFESAGVFPSMETCASCHSSQSIATNACEACHTETVNLFPEDHKIADFRRAHKFNAEDADANCIMCHDQNFCEDCHVSTIAIDETNSAKDFYVPYSPYNYKDGLKRQTIQLAHELNYRYTHGIDAVGKASECQTCHQTETFCVECHNSELGDFNIEGVMPKTHLIPNFTTIGVGSGGGEHAVLAQRDIESCQSCHDVEGADPNCITCHIDNDGVKGTNPKTHPIGFMQDVSGDWCVSDDSMCYSCHITANATTGVPGIGFCGYCHGSNPGL